MAHSLLLTFALCSLVASDNLVKSFSFPLCFDCDLCCRLCIFFFSYSFPFLSFSGSFFSLFCLVLCFLCSLFNLCFFSSLHFAFFSSRSCFHLSFASSSSLFLLAFSSSKAKDCSLVNHSGSLMPCLMKQCIL